MQLSDETLMAFADGEISQAEARDVAALVASDLALAERVETFRRTRVLVAEASQKQDEGSPRDDTALIARIRAAATPAAPIPFPASRSGQVRRRFADSNWKPTAIAASLLMAVGIGWATGLFGTGPTPSGTLDGQIVEWLQGLPSGQTATETSTEFTVVATFRTAGGVLCREYEVKKGEAATLAVACHGAEGWDNRLAIALEPAGDGYVPASGTIEELDAFLDSVGAGAPLSPEDEAAALAQLR